MTEHEAAMIERGVMSRREAAEAMLITPDSLYQWPPPDPKPVQFIQSAHACPECGSKLIKRTSKKRVLNRECRRVCSNKKCRYRDVATVRIVEEILSVRVVHTTPDIASST